VVRISGPFTVEAVPAPAVEDPTEAPIPQFESEEAQARISDRGGDYLTTMINRLKQQGGVLFPGGKKLELQNLRPLNLGYLHAEAEAKQNGNILRVAISFGPQHGPVIAHQVQEAIPTAKMNGYDVLIFAGFAFDPEAHALIQKAPVAGLQVHFANIAPDVLVGDLTIGEQQRLEILKALVRGAKVLILDEPTSTLTPQETEGLFDALRAMSGDGMGVIFISHKLHEIQAITNKVVILRRGEVTATLDDTGNVSRHQLAELMCGHEIVPPVKEPVTPGAPLLVFQNVSTGGVARSRLKDVSFEARAGEILGIAGVSGNGQRELAEIISGMLLPESGSVEINGRVVKTTSPRYVQDLGVARIPEDRMEIGLITALPLKDNMVLPRIHDSRFSRRGILKPRAIYDFVRRQVEIFDIRTPGPDVRTGTLSGGNLQKALLARELAWDPAVLLADQPTRGLDVSAAQFVHQKFLELRKKGRAVILISEDLEELFTLSDRIAVMFEGRINGIMPISEATVQKIGLLMAGVEEKAA